MSSELLQEKDKKVGTYRSPPLETLRARIQVDGEKRDRKIRMYACNRLTVPYRRLERR